MPPILNKWLLGKAGFTLAILVLVVAVLAWILPFFPPAIGFIVALAEIALGGRGGRQGKPHPIGVGASGPCRQHTPSA